MTKKNQKHENSARKLNNYVGPSYQDQVRAQAMGIIEFYLKPVMEELERRFPRAEKLQMKVGFKQGLFIYVETSPEDEKLKMLYPPVHHLQLFVDGMKHVCEIAKYYEVTVVGKPEDGKNNCWIFEKLQEVSESDDNEKLIQEVMSESDRRLAELIASMTKE